MSSKHRDVLSSAVRAKLQQARVARLATLNSKRAPYIVPICFAYDGNVFYTAIDQKPKRLRPERLTRLQNILAVPQVALLIDDYQEDWTKLYYILIRGEAKLVPIHRRRERALAICKLREKYPQYSESMLPDDAPIIRIAPERITFWSSVQGRSLKSSR